METGNLMEKLNKGIHAIEECITDTTDTTPLVERFPITTYRWVTINGKNYKMEIEVTLREIESPILYV